MRPSTSLLQGLRAIQSSIPRSTISRSTLRPLSQLTQRTARPSLTTPAWKTVSAFTIRQNSSASTPNSPLTNSNSTAATEAENEEQNRQRREQEPAYQITFTCKPCGERSSHRMSKHGYHRGTVLIRCPSCQNRHVISDHLNIFFDKSSTLEDILAEKGSKLTRGYVDGDMEFWDDGTANVKTDPESENKSE